MARITLSTHWKFLRLARELGGRVLARGVLEILWEPCVMVGDPYCGTSQDIELLCEWKGERGALTKALLMPDAKNGGFIELYAGSIRNQIEPHYQLHDFFDHCPAYVLRRRQKDHQILTDAKVCEFCKGEYFTASPKQSVYCSPRCRQRAHREAAEKESGHVVETR